MSDSDSDSEEDDAHHHQDKDESGSVWQCLRCPAKNLEKLRKCRLCGTPQPTYDQLSASARSVQQQAAPVPREISPKQSKGTKINDTIKKFNGEQSSDAPPPPRESDAPPPPQDSPLESPPPPPPRESKLVVRSQSMTVELDRRLSQVGDDSTPPAPPQASPNRARSESVPPPPPGDVQVGALQRTSELFHPLPPPDEDDLPAVRRAKKRGSDHKRGSDPPPPPPLNTLPEDHSASDASDSDESEGCDADEPPPHHEYDHDLPPPPPSILDQGKLALPSVNLALPSGKQARPSRSLPESEVEAAEKRKEKRRAGRASSLENSQTGSRTTSSPAMVAFPPVQSILPTSPSQKGKIDGDFMTKLKSLQKGQVDS
eukprot:gb/GEZN01006153.1/.p1 GENE.gb/GEZN01006153.1/~~gb/GEZN01006153.1/.p1  ORF type:complete len:380 (+),score=71.09 gb/GEZN01006153.1/:26-1141(+)